MTRNQRACWLVGLGLVVGLLSGRPAGAQATTDTTEYYHLDAIGNVRVVTNEQGQVVRRHNFQPFGGSTPKRKGF